MDSFGNKHPDLRAHLPEGMIELFLILKQTVMAQDDQLQRVGMKHCFVQRSVDPVKAMDGNMGDQFAGGFEILRMPSPNDMISGCIRIDPDNAGGFFNIIN